MYGIWRYINGISLNGGEWLLDDEDGDIRMFSDRADALAFLHSLGVEGTEDEIGDEEGVFIGEVQQGVFIDEITAEDSADSMIIVR